ncbi:MAG: secretin N-terminal domain-containing protein [Candidatus Poribacteria bacterium]
MSLKTKISFTLIILVLLNIHFGASAASEDSGIVNDNSTIVKLLSIEVSKVTEKDLTVQIMTTGIVQYQPAFYKKASGRIMVFYVDISNSYNCIDSGGLVRITPSIPSHLPVDTPVIRIDVAQFSLEPPISRVVFFLRKPVPPTIMAKAHSLSFTFPTIPKQKDEQKSPTEVKKTDTKKGPAVIAQIKPIFEPKATKLHIISNGQLNFQKVVSEKNPPNKDIEAVLELDFTNAISNLPKEIPIHRKSFIHKVTLYTKKGPPPSCKITIQLTKRVFYDISNIDKGLQISFENPVLDRIVTIKSDNESLSKLLFMLFKQYGANIVLDKGVDPNQKVTFNLENVPLKVALNEILDSLGYRYEEVNDGILRIVAKSQPPVRLDEDRGVPEKSALPPKLETKSFTLQHAPVSKLSEVLQSLISKDGKIIDDERTKSVIIMDTPETLAALGDTMDEIVSELDKEAPEEEKPLLEQSALPEIKFIKRVIKLEYADPEELKKIFTPLLSPAGNIEAFAKSSETGGGTGGSVSRSGTGGSGGAGMGTSVGQGGYLIITDTSEIVSQIEREISKLDVPIPQVEIQAYIVEGILSDEIESGVDWSWTRQGTKTEISANALGTEKGSGTLRLSYGNLPAAEFTAVLTALSSKSDTKVLSSPRITVLENNQAKFHSGDQIGFSQITTNIQEGTRTVETIFQDVGIELTVSPQVKSNDTISLLVNVQVRDLGEVTPTGEPTISDRSAQTQLLVRDGDTAVIGGLTSDRIIANVTKVPILGNIPILKRLFSYKKNTKKKTEMTFFITPRIVKTGAGNQAGIE